MKKIILIGAGGHAKSCIDTIENAHQKLKIHGLIDKRKSDKKLFNYKIIGSDKDLKSIRKKIRFAFVAVGQIKSPLKRIEIYKNLEKNGYELPTIISKKAYVSKYSKIGKGTIVMHGAIINAGVKIGNNCIINSNCIVEHDVIIGNNCHIASGASISGNVKILQNCFVGSNATIKENIKIGNSCIIGSNIFLNKNLNSKTIYY